MYAYRNFFFYSQNVPWEISFHYERNIEAMKTGYGSLHLEKYILIMPMLDLAIESVVHSDLTWVEAAATQTTAHIVDCILPSLLEKLETVSRSLSTPPLGLLAGLIVPVSYVMGHCMIDIEGTSWKEVSIVWLLLHMSSGSCKSNITRFLKLIEQSMAHTLVKPNEITFESLGMAMQQNHYSIYFFYDNCGSLWAS